MSNIFYDKYSDKSLIVRGTSLEAKKFRNKLRDQMEGACRWINTVKDNKGPGLLIADNEKNRKTLECYTQMTQILKNDDDISGNNIQNNITDINQNVAASETKIENNNDANADDLNVDDLNADDLNADDLNLNEQILNEKTPISEDKITKEVCTQTTDELNTKKKYETCTKRNENRDINIKMMNASPRLRSRREDPTPHRANDYYRKHSKGQQTPEYSDSDDDQSDEASINSLDEKTNERIRKLGKMKRRRGAVEELLNRDEIDENEPVDSEDEDIVTLSRRIRYILRCTNVLRTNIENVDERVEKVERKVRRLR